MGQFVGGQWKHNNGNGGEAVRLVIAFVTFILAAPAWGAMAFNYGSHCTAVSATVARCWVSTNDTAPTTNVAVEYGTDTSYSSVKTITSAATFPDRFPASTNDYTAVVELTGLTKETTYYYRFVLDRTGQGAGAVVGSDANYGLGSFQTPPDHTATDYTSFDFRLGFGACWNEGHKPFDIFTELKRWNLFGFFHMGDLIYGYETTLTGVRSHFHAVMSDTPWREAARFWSIYSIWDDHEAQADNHDFGPTDGENKHDGTHASKVDEGRQASWEYFFGTNPSVSNYVSTQWAVGNWVPYQLFYYFQIGSVFFLVTDNISFRDFYANSQSDIDNGAPPYWTRDCTNCWSPDDDCKSMLDDASAAGSACSGTAEVGRQSPSLGPWSLTSNQGEMADRTAPAVGTFLADAMTYITTASNHVKYVVYVSSKPIYAGWNVKDTWEKYTTERDNLMKWLVNGIGNRRLIVLAGDDHSAYTERRVIEGKDVLFVTTASLGIYAHGILNPQNIQNYAASHNFWYYWREHEGVTDKDKVSHGAAGILDVHDSEHYIDVLHIDDWGRILNATRVWESGFDRARQKVKNYGSGTKAWGATRRAWRIDPL